MTNRRNDVLTMITIYRYPRDYPDRFVIRECRIGRGYLRHSPDAAFAATADEARAHVARRYPGAVCVQRQGDDPDPVVFEVWC